MKKIIISICLIFACLLGVGCGEGSSQSSSHRFALVPQKQATCAQKGNVEHYKCLDCGKLFDLNKKQITSVETDICLDNHESEVYLAVKTQPQKLLYSAGESFDANGLEIVKKCDSCNGKIVDNGLIAFSYQNQGANSFSQADTKIIATVDGLTIDITISLTAVYTVTFDTQGGTQIAPVCVADGGKLPLIETPEKSNENGEYEFVCWLYNGEEWDVETDVVREDMTLVAKWKVVSSYTPPYVPKD